MFIHRLYDQNTRETLESQSFKAININAFTVFSDVLLLKALKGSNHEESTFRTSKKCSPQKAHLLKLISKNNSF